MFVASNLKTLRKRLKKSQEEIATDLSLTRSTYSGYENGIAQPGLETLMALGVYFNCSIDDLLRVDFNSFTDEEWLQWNRKNEFDVKGSKLRILTSMVDVNNEDVIELIPQQARAGYTTGYSDPDYLKILPTFNLPFLTKDRKYRSFPIKGDSMPPVVDGSYVVAEYIQNWITIKDGTPCIVVTKEDGIVFKIVNNYLSQHKYFELCSTNPIYQPYTVPLTEVLEIWKFVNYISPEFNETRADDQQLTRSIQDLQKEVADLKRTIQTNNRIIN